MDKKSEATPPSVGDYDDSQSTYTVDQPPPAYRKPEVPAVKLAKIVAATILLVAVIIGVTSVSIVYLQHNMKCAEMAQTTPQETTKSASPRSSDLPETAKVIQEEGDEETSSTEDGKFLFPDLATSETEDKLKQLNFPIHIDMDELTGKMMEKNQRARLNCVIEKKRSEEIIPRSPKTLQTPFGNLTTDPKFTHVTGETMSLTCRSGNEKVSRPVSEASTPILIQIPVQRNIQPLPMRPPQSPRPSGTPLLSPLQALQHLQQQQQQQPRPSINLQLHQARPQILHDQQAQQQRLLPQIAQHFPMPLLPLPQIPLHQVIPQLLEVHKQLQQERQREEQEQEMNQAPDRQETRAEGRALPIHDVPMQRIPTSAHPAFPHIQFGHHPEQQQQQRQGPPPPPPQHQQVQQQQHHEQQHQDQSQHIPLPHHRQQQQQQHSQDEEQEVQQGVDAPLEGAPSFHDGPQIIPADMTMMSRMQPAPFLIGSHNMQPRSSVNPRMKRMAGSCSCVCK